MNSYKHIARDGEGNEIVTHFNFNSDLSGEVRITNETQLTEVWVPADALLAFVASRVRAHTISQLEEQLNDTSGLRARIFAAPETVDQIVDREILASVAWRRKDIANLREEAARLLALASSADGLLNKQIRCNDMKRHEWVDGGGGCAGRFIDLCKNCGWEHTS